MISLLARDIDQAKITQQLLKTLDHDSKIANTPEDISDSDILIIDNLAPCDSVIKEYVKNGIFSTTKKEIFCGKPVIGINRGMHLLFTSSDENGYYQGLNVLSGHAHSLKRPVKGIKHVQFKDQHPFFLGLNEPQIPFDFSYYVDVDNESDILAIVRRESLHLPVIVMRDNICGVQLSIDKGSEFAINLIDRFIKEKKEEMAINI